MYVIYLNNNKGIFKYYCNYFFYVKVCFCKGWKVYYGKEYLV